MFRTPTGQTGRDAYRYELAQVENAQRALDERMARLCAAMDAELGDDATSGREFGGRVRTVDRVFITRVLAMCGRSDGFSIDTVRELIAHLRDES
jgi:hypothetical protein